MGIHQIIYSIRDPEQYAADAEFPRDCLPGLLKAFPYRIPKLPMTENSPPPLSFQFQRLSRSRLALGLASPWAANSDRDYVASFGLDSDLDAAGLSDSALDFADPSDSAPDFVGPSDSDPDFAGPSGSALDFAGPSGSVPDFAGPPGSALDFANPPGSDLDFAGPSGSDNPLPSKKSGMTHIILFDRLTDYPCRYYGSSLFHSLFQKKLPVAPPIPGAELTRAAVARFLRPAHRAAAYQGMLAALFAYESSRKRLVICDKPAHILLWIAALHYALPLELALTVSFASYVYDPARSPAQICGVCPRGTKYRPADALDHFTFDLLLGTSPQTETKGCFYPFIRRCMTQPDPKALEDFHHFLQKELFYAHTDLRYPKLYALYRLETLGLSALDPADFRDAAEVSRSIHRTQWIRLLLARNRLPNELNMEACLAVFDALYAALPQLSDEDGEEAKNFVTRKFISVFAAAPSQEDFADFYQQLDRLCQKHGLHMARALMRYPRREQFIDSVIRQPEPWRWIFLMDLLCEYSLLEKLPPHALSPTQSMGQLMGKMLSACTALDSPQGLLLAREMLQKFSEQWDALANVALTIHQSFRRLPGAQGLLSSLWDRMDQLIRDRHARHRMDFCRFFLAHDCQDRVYRIFLLFLDQISDIGDAARLFREHCGIRHRDYLQNYALKICQVYYAFLRSHPGSGESAAYRELLRVVVGANLSPDFLYALVQRVLSALPLSPLSDRDYVLISHLVGYYGKRSPADHPPRFVLITAGMLLSRASADPDLAKDLPVIRHLADHKPIDLTGLSPRETEQFLEWIMPPVFRYCGSAQDLIRVYLLFHHSPQSALLFMDLYLTDAIGAPRENKRKDIVKLLFFLELYFSVGRESQQQPVAKLLGSLSGQRMTLLDRAVPAQAWANKRNLVRWRWIRSTAAEHTSLWRNLEDQILGLLS